MKTIEEVLKEIGEDKNQNLSTTSFKFKSDGIFSKDLRTKLQLSLEPIKVRPQEYYHICLKKYTL